MDTDGRIAVVGSRRITEGVAEVLDALGIRPDVIVSGGAVGVDQQAAAWARSRGVPIVEHLPDYKAHGRHAPHVRNRRIVDDCDVLVTIWLGDDGAPWPPNAEAMRHRARRRGVPVIGIREVPSKTNPLRVAVTERLRVRAALMQRRTA